MKAIVFCSKRHSHYGPSNSDNTIAAAANSANPASCSKSCRHFLFLMRVAVASHYCYYGFTIRTRNHTWHYAVAPICPGGRLRYCRNKNKNKTNGPSGTII